jgi:hypothetical protein
MWSMQHHTHRKTVALFRILASMFVEILLAEQH